MSDPAETVRHGDRIGRAIEHFSIRTRRTSLYVRVVAVNTTIVVAATLVLALTPATVGYPIRIEEAVVLVVGVGLVVAANALVLKISFAPLANVVVRMRTVDLLRPRERLPVVGGPEIRSVVTGFNQMLDRLEAERRQSSRRTLAALEGERRRIARELHDEVGQRLTGMVLQLGNLVPDAPRELKERLGEIQEHARDTLDQVGVLAWQLRPGILDDLGLLRALAALVESFEEQTPRIRIHASLPPALPAIPSDAELAIYRIVQEALTNAVRHAGATRIDVALAVDDRRLTFAVADDGVGRSPSEGEGAGLRGMRERALAIGGTLIVESTPGQGARVRLELPRPAAP